MMLNHVKTGLIALAVGLVLSVSAPVALAEDAKAPAESTGKATAEQAKERQAQRRENRDERQERRFGNREERENLRQGQADERQSERQSHREERREARDARKSDKDAGAE